MQWEEKSLHLECQNSDFTCFLTHKLRMSGVISKRIALILLLTDEGASLGLIAHFQRLHMANIITIEEHKALNMYILRPPK